MSSNNYQSDDEATKAELAKFDCMVDDGIICISDSESEKGSHGNKDKGKDRGQGDGDDKDGVVFIAETAPKVAPRIVPRTSGQQSQQAAATETPRQLPPLPPASAASTSNTSNVLQSTAYRRRRQQHPTLQYPQGVVRRTRMRGESASEQTVTLSDVLSVPGQLLEKALLTTFVLEETWLLNHFSLQTKLVIVKNYNPHLERQGVYQDSTGRLTYVNPQFANQRYPIMHSKLMLLFYPNCMRFVASSANLLQIDWTVLGNIVFIQDFPLAEAPMVKELCGFSADLAAALRDLSVPEPVVEQLLRVDFSLARAHIVTSVPSAAGRSKFHTNAYGISRLHQVCEGMWKSWDHDKQTVALTNTTLYCYGSSMGRLNDRYLRDFYLRALGLTDETHRMLYKKATGKYATIEHMASHVLVGFPTKAQALANPFGELAAESIKFQKQFYDNPDYPVNNLRKIKPTVPGCLMHSKVILARCGPTEGWIYLGSHNFTPGAWGHAKYGTRNAYVNNYEFGVILPDVTFESVFGRDSVMWNGTSVPLPFALDWQPYAEDDVPFLFDP